MALGGHSFHLGLFSFILVAAGEVVCDTDDKLKDIEAELRFHRSPITFHKMIIAYRLAGRDDDAVRVEVEFQLWIGSLNDGTHEHQD